jgi:glycosyltransferase involved in cell wall biosynthesis
MFLFAVVENGLTNLCEAMIFGVPCVSAFAAGIGLLISNKVNGLPIHPYDPWARAGAMLEIAANENEVVHLGNNARKDAQKIHNK